MGSYEFVKLEVSDGLAILTMNRPEKLNAVNDQMRAEIGQAIEEVGLNDAARVLIVTGAGRGFCAGADVTGMAGVQDMSRRKLLSLVGSFVMPLARLEKPTIAAVNGPAAGIGLTVALLCDIRIAADNVKFSAAWIKRGLIPDGGATFLLPRIIGAEKAYQMMYLGETIDAAKAKEIGMISRVVPPDKLMSTARDLAGKIAMGPPIAQELIKRAVARKMVDELAEQLQFETYAQNICRKTEDHKEGVAAFLEKREAKFRGM